VAGLAGLVAAKAVLVAIGALLLVRASARAAGARAITVLLLPAALFAARHLLLVRPVIVTLVFLALFFVVLERFRCEQRPRLLLLLLPLQVAWANCQGLFALGPALVAFYLAGAALTATLGRRAGFPFAREGGVGPLALALGGCLVAGLVTPYGLGAPRLAVALLARIVPHTGNLYAANIAENVPPWVAERTAPGLFWHLRWALVIVAASLVAGRQRLLASHTLMLLALAALALMANRNVLLLYWLGAPVAAMNLGPGLARLAQGIRDRGRAASLAGGALVASALAAVAALEAVALAREPSLASPTPFRVPAQSAQLIAAAPGNGRIFAADHQGGYLIWALYPRAKPYMDTRLILRTSAQLAEYLAAIDEPERFAALHSREQFDWVVLPTSFPDRYLGLVRTLYRSPEWTLVYTDGQETLFARGRRGDAVDLGARHETERLVAQCNRRFPGDAVIALHCRLHLATLDLVLGVVGEAKRALAGLDAPEARTLLARCLIAEGDLAGASALARELVARDGNDAEALALLAVAAVGQGDVPQGLEWARRALRADPHNATARAVLERMEHR
jgi:tetratricopeptide (TPR) repeat protein